MSTINIHPLQQARKKLGIKQKVLAELIGLSEATIKRAESGKVLDDYTVYTICEFFAEKCGREVTPQELGLHRQWEENIDSDNNKTPHLDNISYNDEETIEPDIKNNAESNENMNRRTALQALATLGFTVVTSPQDLLRFQPGKELLATPTKPASIPLETWNSFEDLTRACWRLSATELETAKDLLSTYLPRVERLAQQSFEHQPIAAGIASQGYQLASILVGHKLDFITREAYGRRALLYGEMAADRNIYMAALTRLVTTLIITNRPLEAVQMYQAALPYLNNQISPLLLTDLEVKVAVAYARCGQDQESNRHLFRAQEALPERPEHDPCFLYADSGHGILFLWEGLMYLENDNPEKAGKAFENIEKLPSTTIIPKRVRIEIVNHQAEAAIASGDKEFFKDRIRAGIQGANELNSDKRRQEVWDFYGQARKVWPYETDIKRLREELISGAI